MVQPQEELQSPFPTWEPEGGPDKLPCEVGLLPSHPLLALKDDLPGAPSPPLGEVLHIPIVSSTQLPLRRKI